MAEILATAYQSRYGKDGKLAQPMDEELVMDLIKGMVYDYDVCLNMVKECVACKNYVSFLLFFLVSSMG